MTSSLTYSVCLKLCKTSCPPGACHSVRMYVHDKLELPVPAELEHHFEMIKVRV
jgi:hypothetical protein